MRIQGLDDQKLKKFTAEKNKFFDQICCLVIPRPESLTFKEPRNLFQGINLAKLHRLEESIPGFLKRLQIRDQKKSSTLKREHPALQT
jgi:hypothetical protein